MVVDPSNVWVPVMNWDAELTSALQVYIPEPVGPTESSVMELVYLEELTAITGPLGESMPPGPVHSTLIVTKVSTNTISNSTVQVRVGEDPA